MTFRIEEECDASYDEESRAMLTYSEWWNVTNLGKQSEPSRSFRCESEDDAQWLCDLLNSVLHS